MKRCVIWGGARKGGLEGACYQCVMVLSAHLQLSLVQAEEVAAVGVQGKALAPCRDVWTQWRRGEGGEERGAK